MEQTKNLNTPLNDIHLSYLFFFIIINSVDVDCILFSIYLCLCVCVLCSKCIHQNIKLRISRYIRRQINNKLSWFKFINRPINGCWVRYSETAYIPVSSCLLSKFRFRNNLLIKLCPFIVPKSLRIKRTNEAINMFISIGKIHLSN